MSYFAATSLINGSAGAQNLASLENPAGSGKRIFVNQVYVDGVINTGGATIFLYRLARTTGAPSAGTALTIPKGNTADGAAVGVARQAPTATAAAGDIAVGAPGIVIPGTLGIGPAAYSKDMKPLFQANENNTSLILAPGEAILVIANANDTAWRHYVTFVWDESSQ